MANLLKHAPTKSAIEAEGTEDGLAKVALYVWDAGLLEFIAYEPADFVGGVGDATAAKQDLQTAELVDINRSTSKEEALKIDEASDTVTYVGLAAIGTGGASALWKIKKIETTGSVTVVVWADGNANYDNVWNDRASLSYS